MSDNATYQVRPHAELIAEILDCRVAKTEREYAAAREIERLLALVEAKQTEIERALAACGALYMDPPDGGSVTVAEQLQRMAKDAARYRWLADNCRAYWSGQDAEMDPVQLVFYEPNITTPKDGWRERLAARIDADIGSSNE